MDRTSPDPEAEMRIFDPLSPPESCNAFLEIVPVINSRWRSAAEKVTRC